MAYPVTWTTRASDTLYEQVEYLAQNWSAEVVTAFVDKAYHIVDLLREFPEMGQVLDSEHGIRGVLINRHVRLSYLFENSTIILLRFSSTRKN